MKNFVKRHYWYMAVQHQLPCMTLEYKFFKQAMAAGQYYQQIYMIFIGKFYNALINIIVINKMIRWIKTLKPLLQAVRLGYNF